MNYIALSIFQANEKGQICKYLEENIFKGYVLALGSNLIGLVSERDLQQSYNLTQEISVALRTTAVYFSCFEDEGLLCGIYNCGVQEASYIIDTENIISNFEPLKSFVGDIDDFQYLEDYLSEFAVYSIEGIKSFKKVFNISEVNNLSFDYIDNLHPSILNKEFCVLEAYITDNKASIILSCDGIKRLEEAGYCYDVEYSKERGIYGFYKNIKGFPIGLEFSTSAGEVFVDIASPEHQGSLTGITEYGEPDYFLFNNMTEFISCINTAADIFLRYESRILEFGIPAEITEASSIFSCIMDDFLVQHEYIRITPTLENLIPGGEVVYKHSSEKTMLKLSHSKRYTIINCHINIASSTKTIYEYLGETIANNYNLYDFGLVYTGADEYEEKLKLFKEILERHVL